MQRMNPGSVFALCSEQKVRVATPDPGGYNNASL